MLIRFSLIIFLFFFFCIYYEWADTISFIMSQSKGVLKLYRDLLKYGNSLKYTNKGYYKSRIRQEFLKNAHMESQEQIEFQISVMFVISEVVRYSLYFVIYSNMCHE